MNEELIAKVKAAKSPEELLALAKENDVALTEEKAKALFARLHPATGELDDDELDAVSGGGCDGSKDPKAQVKEDLSTFTYDLWAWATGR